MDKESRKQIGLYIHIPWCIQKCPYCDFNSHQIRQPTDEAAYVRALQGDLLADLSALPNADLCEVDSIFFGGGTPSTFSAEAIGHILEMVDQSLSVSTDCEITLEANPGASEQSRFVGYRAAGINRLSMGIQSFDQQQLKQLGRIHSGQEAEQAIAMAKSAGFDNLNLDMMFALPGQTLSEAKDDLQQLIAAVPQHISYYQLTIEPNTYFYAHPPVIPDGDLQADIQAQGQELLANAGYTQYEISAYAQANRLCRHNLHYWQFDDYIGIGAGAHGKWTASDGQVSRSWKHKQPRQYQASLIEHGQAIGSVEAIVPEREVFEYLLNRLRLYQPITFPEMASKLACWSPSVLDDIRDILTGKVSLGLIRWIYSPDHEQPSGFELTDHGRLFVNQILLDFLPE